MAVTYTPIFTTTLSSPTNSVTLNSFSGYTDLKLVVNASFNTEDYACYQFNSDTGSNYSETPIVGNGSSLTSGRAANRAFIFTQAVAGSGIPFMIQSNFMSYANGSIYKTVLTRTDCVSRDVTMSAGLWRNSGAITSIKLYGLVGNSFQSGSTFTLYGIAAA